VRFETILPANLRVEVARAYIEAHPYEEPAFDIFPVRTPARVGAGRRALGGVDVAAVIKALGRLNIAAVDVTETDTPATAASGGMVAVSCGSATAMLHELLVTDVFGLVVCSSATDAERALLVERGMTIICVDRTNVLSVLGEKLAARLSRELGLRVQVAHALEFPESGPVAGAGSVATAGYPDEAPDIMEGTTVLTSREQAGPPGAGGVAGVGGAAKPGTWKLHFDGGSRGNPGPAAYGFVLVDPSGVEVARVGEVVGRTTNNVAEYTGPRARARAGARGWGRPARGLWRL